MTAKKRKKKWNGKLLIYRLHFRSVSQKRKGSRARPSALAKQNFPQFSFDVADSQFTDKQVDILNESELPANENKMSG